MKDTNDVSKLFEEIGGNAKAYREITRAERAGEALARWPLLSSLQEEIAKSASPEDASLLSIPVGRVQVPQLPQTEPTAADVPLQPPLLAEWMRTSVAPTTAFGVKGHQADVRPVVETASGLPQFGAWVQQDVARADRKPVSSARTAEPSVSAAGFSLAEKLALHRDEVSPAVATSKVDGTGLNDVFQRLLGEEAGRPAASGHIRDASDTGRDELAAVGLTLAQRLNRL